MREEARVRSALIQAAQAVEVADLSNSASAELGKRARERAVGTLQYLTTDPENKEPMWDDLEIRSTLIKATTAQTDGKLRIYALGSLWNLSSCPSNQEKMWLD